MALPNTGGADQEIIVRFTVESASAIKNAEEFRAQVETIKKQLIDLQAQSGQSFKDIAEGMKRAAENQFMQKLDKSGFQQYSKALTVALREAEQGAKGLDAELESKPKDVGNVSKSFLSLGNVAKYVFGTILGISAITALRNLFRWIGDLTEQGYEFTKSMFKAAVAINAMRFRGVNASIEQTIEWVKELRKEFGVLSEQEALGVISTTQLLTRNLGYTEEQIKKVIEVSTALAIVQGKDVLETSRQLVLFFSSGYGEGLQKAGIAVNRFAVAQEALKMGFGKSYMALTEQQRAAAAYSLVIKQTGEIVDQAATYQNNLAGQIDKTKKETETLTNRMGLLLVPLKKFWVELQLTAITALSWIIKKIAETMLWFAKLGLSVETLAARINNAFARISGAATVSLDDVGKYYKDWIDKLEKFTKDFNLADEMAKVLEESPIKDTPVDIVLKLDDEAARNVAENIMEILSQSADKLVDIEGNLQNELAGIDANGAAIREGIWQEYANKVNEINQKLADDILKLQNDLAQDILNVQLGMQQDLADATRKYQENEWKAERDFQERMQRLREGFLFDLEDALRERDAVQIMRLYRRYALDVTQTTRQYEMEKEERRRAYQEELADIRRQAQIRIEELRREAALREAELRAEAEKEKKLLEEATKIDYEKALEEYKQWLRDRIEELVIYLGKEKNLTEDQIRDVLGLLKDELVASGMKVEEAQAIIDSALDTGIKKLDALYALENSVTKAATEWETAINDAAKAFDELILKNPLTLPTALGPPLPEIKTTPIVQDITTTFTPPVDDVKNEIQSIVTAADFSTQENIGVIPLEISPPVDEVIADLNKIGDMGKFDTKEINIQVTPPTNEITASMEERRVAAEAEYKAMQEDFGRFLDERYRRLDTALRAELKITKSYTNSMIRVLRAAFGRGGLAESIYNYLNRIIANAVAVATAAVNQLIALANQAQSLANQINATVPATQPTSYYTGTQSGGYVGKGVRMLGEQGYEFVLSNPTTKALESALGGKLTQENVLKMVGGGGNSKAVIEVWLSPGLEGEIINKAMDEVAGTLDAVIRRR